MDQKAKAEPAYAKKLSRRKRFAVSTERPEELAGDPAARPSQDMEVEQPAAAASGDPQALEDGPSTASEARKRVDDADGTPGTKRTTESDATDTRPTSKSKSVLKIVDKRPSVGKQEITGCCS